MIRKDTFLSALSLSDKLASTGKTLSVKPNTVISELVRLSIPPLNYRMEVADDLNNFANILEAVTTGEGDMPSQHTLELNGLIDDLSNAVKTHISFAKNTVKPLVVEMAKSISEYRMSNKTKDPAEKFTIYCKNIPQLLNDEFFLDSLDFYKGKSILKPDLVFKLGPKTKEELQALLLTGDSKTDKLILEWISDPEVDTDVSEVWNGLFADHTKVPQGEEVKGYLDLDRANIYEKTDFALIMYLLSKRLYENIDDSAKDINLSTYKNTAAQYRDYAGALLVDCIKKLALYNKTNMLVVEVFPEKYTATVNGEVYKPWLVAGGSPEIILGLIVSGEKVSSKALIDEKSNRYLDIWNSYVTFHNVDQSVKAFDYFKSFLTYTFGSQLKPLPEEQDFIETNPLYYSNVKKLLEEELASLKTCHMEDDFGNALRLVAKCRFYYTSAYEILSDINKAGEVNPNVDVREAALIAVINYITDYAADQISLSNE